MAGGKDKVRIGVDFHKCQVNNDHSVTHFSEHGCDFMVTKLFDETATKRLSTAKKGQKYLGETPVKSLLNSLEWSNLIVSRIHVDEDLEGENMQKSNDAQDALQVNFASKKECSFLSLMTS